MEGPLGLGYDAGGNGRHGLAAVSGDPPRLAAAACASTAGEALAWLQGSLAGATPRAVGIDTLLAWSLGPSGDRRAEAALRQAYPAKARSVMCPNSLFGAMPLGGMAVAMRLRQADTHLRLTEVHPGVLAHALEGTREGEALQGIHTAVGAHDLTPAQEPHARDAATCALAAWHVAQGNWTRDLLDGDDLVSPLDAPRFHWPDGVA